MSLVSQLGRPRATGFTSNQRPAIHYKLSWDCTGSPSFKPQSDSFMSQTKRHYQPHASSHYSGSLPNLINKTTGGIGLQQLRILSETEPVEEKTEYQRVFAPRCLKPSVPPIYVVVGPKERTGFTEETERQFNTFQDKSCCTVKRQTPFSVMKTDFVRPSFQQGTEVIPGLCNHSYRETGYTRNGISPLACQSSLLPSTQTTISVPTIRTIGKKEPTGYILNAPSNFIFPKTPLDSSHFTTHYESRFGRHGDLKQMRYSQTPGIISVKMSSSYNRRDTDRFIFRH